MTTQMLAAELANLIQESKRKNNDLRQAAEKSLEELKAIGSVSEQAVPDVLSQKANFVNPFIIACGTKNAKFTGIAIVCLQRLIVARALPRAKLNQVLEALMQASSANLDVQLKILQALPSLLQNYATELKGDLLVTALNICFILQSSKNAIVNNTSAATLQQLVVSVFDKVVTEDKNGDAPVVGEAPTQEGKVKVRAAALDAYRIFNDLCLLTENQRPEYLRFSGLSQTFGLELVESVITNHATVFMNHPEQAEVIRARVMPFIMSALKAKPTFATTVRLFRILYTILRRHLSILPTECGEALEIMIQILDQDTTLWKKALCMEVFRGLFAEHALIRRIFALYDAQKNGKRIVIPLTASFVRLSTEKPAVIGLGPQSTMPLTISVPSSGITPDQTMLEASGVGGIIAPVGTEATHTGISTQWSSIRVPCIDQLDKTEPPTIPESYTYSLILACLSSLSDGLAKFILPLTVPADGKPRRKASKANDGRSSPSSSSETGGGNQKAGLERTASFKKNPVPQNPLQLRDHPMSAEVKICSQIVDECWPAILATCSTFLYSAMDSEYYHGLVRAFQRFAHVAGLLQLSTPRDAFLTTLGKAAVPPNIMNASMSGQARPTTPSTPAETPNTLLGNARGLLSVESLTPTSPLAEKQRQFSGDLSATLNTRNLLCLRALLNLGIALGPTLGQAWGIILETLQQADFVLNATGKAASRASTANRQEQSGDGDGSLMSNFGPEVRSVQTAASRLIESTVDFPNEPFMEVVAAICHLLQRKGDEKADNTSLAPTASPSTSQQPFKPGQHRRVLSFSSPASSGTTQEDQFALQKLGDIALINIERLLTYPPAESGWNILVEQLIRNLESTTVNTQIRVRAAEILSRLMLEAARAASSIPIESRGSIQLRLLKALRQALEPLGEHDRDISVPVRTTDTEIHKIILEALTSIIEDCGESLVNGWEVAFEIIGTIFVSKDTQLSERRGSVMNPILLTTRSSKLIRPSFTSLQLICSDFLASLPNSCFLILVDTMYNFCSQDDDLNIALTTVTFFWVLSDFLSGKGESLSITADVIPVENLEELVEMAADRSRKGADAALWMLLLLRLTTVASDDRLDLRNSAIQTLLRIFDAYGDRLSPEAWSICIKSVVFRLLTSVEEEIKVADEEKLEASHRSDWHGTAVVVLNGISGLLANYLHVLTSHPSFNQLWRELLGHFASLLDFKVLSINTAAFKALSHVLSQKSDDGKPNFNETTVNFAWELWSRGIPMSVSDDSERDNQGCLSAYVGALREVYKLIEADLTVGKVKKMLGLLCETVKEASVSSYSSDVEHATSLQSQTLDAVQMIRTDVIGVPSAMITQVSEFVTLAFEGEQGTGPGSKRTFVAMSKASMKLLETLISAHASDKDIYQSGAFSTALAALCRPTALKYDFPIVTKSVQPWKMATSTVLSVLKSTLPLLSGHHLARGVNQDIWTLVASIANGILSADCDSAPSRTDFADDETFDIASFQNLRSLIIPALGAEVVLEKSRKAYAESLFKTSIIHTPAPADAAVIFGGNEANLSALYKQRPGRTVASPSTKRSRIAYVAFEELFTLVSCQDASEDEPPAAKNSTYNEDPSDCATRIACTSAPYLILRCALTLRAYVADQPLRGKMPQPLSQRKEILWILKKLVALRSESEAIPELRGVESESRKHLLRLYPLLVRALEVTGDVRVLGVLREALEIVGGELGA